MQGRSATAPAWAETYDPAELALKHGLTIEQARIVINSNGPSKQKCDVSAVAFRRALDMCGNGKRASPRKRSGAAHDQNQVAE
ncbi:hypothetical protein FJW06_15340 [Mesorhizobium sp. B4-1-3]|uniref:hypothetical protein n=1 Tax=Mesorhizobium sp. B4-1-3 TaxID=2589889 RepID=UPI00112DC4C1|nr:hypothetical protein [Mesorhizobium sp. B4-1-3]TPI13029.1 hypothetical protein FJW06_15340 [Mesorhizobium sp. B4-1-3]